MKSPDYIISKNMDMLLHSEGEDMKKNNLMLCLMLLLCLLLTACGEPEIVVTGKNHSAASAEEPEKEVITETEAEPEAVPVPETGSEMRPAAEECSEVFKKAQRLISEAETGSSRMDDELRNAVTQADMNALSYDIYVCWDNCLNEIWKLLGENLSSEEMKTLIKEEVKWIEMKEKASEEAGQDSVGGTMHALEVNTKAAELTRTRTYELLKYFR